VDYPGSRSVIHGPAFSISTRGRANQPPFSSNITSKQETAPGNEQSPLLGSHEGVGCSRLSAPARRTPSAPSRLPNAANIPGQLIGNTRDTFAETSLKARPNPIGRTGDAHCVTWVTVAIVNRSSYTHQTPL
jgi:hypothetical protein